MEKNMNKHQSLRQKFIRLFMLIAATMALISSVLFVAYQYVYVKYQEINNLRILSQVISENAQAAILFQDKESIDELLQSLKANYDIEYAAVYLPDKTLFTEQTFYQNQQPTISLNNLIDQKVQYSWSGVKVLSPVTQNNEILGYVVVSSNLNALHHAVYQTLKITAIIFLLSVLIAYVLSQIMVKALITPILNMARFSQKVSQDKDYSYRLVNDRNDELGILMEQFNLMLAQIEQQNKELIEAKEKAESSSKAKEHFLANMSHEIRTPLNAIDGMAKLLKETPLNQEQKEYLSAMESSTANLLVIINDILDISKIEAGQLTIEKIGFKPEKLLHDVVKSLQLKAQEKNIFLHLDYDPSIPEILIGDPVRLTQVIINLVNNAIKFTQKGGVTISVKYQGTENDCAGLLFEIIDTGIGIPEDKIDTIFENFKQADDSTTRKFGGTGLGLSISKKIVELFGGELQVKSKVNFGSTFYFTLCLPLGTEDDLPESENPQEIEMIHEVAGKKVLLVEDHEINRFLATTVLENWKMQVEVAENGKEAVEKVKNNSYDIVLMDMQMPVMGGVEATQIIRQELHSQVPIIALTANAIKGDAEKCKQAGMNDYVSKPFDPSDLYNKILTLINQ